MNKTVTVNLGGTIFNIEEEAFFILRNYLERVKLNFTGDPGEGEIMTDIEVRISELFTERLDEKRNVVVKSHVEEVIVIMGQPEDFVVGDSASNSETEHERIRHNKRRIYRDREDAVLGGVSAGLAHYFGWDPLILRIVFVVFAILSAGTAIFAYILLWALIPEAKTTAEKLQMRGEPVNVENIRRFVNREARKAGENVSRWSNTVGSNQQSHFLTVMGTVVSKLVGVFMIFLGFGLLGSLLSLFIFAEFSFFGASDFNLDQFNQLIFGDTGSYWMLTLGITLVLGIPAVALLYGGFKLLIGSARKIKGLGWSLAALFFLGVVLSSIGGIRMGREFSADAELRELKVLPANSIDTLVVNVNPDIIFTGRSANDRDDFFELIQTSGDTTYLGEPIDLAFEESSNTEFSVRVIRKSRGAGKRKAGELASNIQYNWSIESNELKLDPIYSIPAGDPFRGQEVEIVVLIPRGKSVKFGDNIGLIWWDREMAGQTRIMWEDNWVAERPLEQQTDSTEKSESGKTIYIE